ncbi:hypothetical protein R1sor_012030 [Riccia sorocarpa]|uniref:DDE Tnp4 domain-containing protein n=1 Tax=Riccia sorocarpa TaxID=122646 RepID=A0ABD3I8S8_9MARC
MDIFDLVFSLLLTWDDWDLDDIASFLLMMDDEIEEILVVLFPYRVAREQDTQQSEARRNGTGTRNGKGTMRRGSQRAVAGGGMSSDNMHHARRSVRDEGATRRGNRRVEVMPSTSNSSQGTIEICPFIIGDVVYPLTPFLQKAYDTRRTGEHSRNAYDKNLQRARVRIDHTFGLLKGRWSILASGVPLHMRMYLRVSKHALCYIILSITTGLHFLMNTKERSLHDYRPFVDGEGCQDIPEIVHKRRTQEDKKVRLALFRKWSDENAAKVMNILLVIL